CSRRRARHIERRPPAWPRADLTSALLADAVDEAVAAAARPAVLRVDGAQGVERLLVARRELEHLAVHGGGAGAELRAAVQLAQREVGLGRVGCLADDLPEHLLRAVAPLRVLHVRAGEDDARAPAALRLQARHGRLQELDGVPVFLLRDQ